jgi:hypothetical protein
VAAKSTWISGLSKGLGLQGLRLRVKGGGLKVEGLDCMV